MSDQKNAELPFGEQLLGMQGFNAARAQRYRAEMEKLLSHRLARHERWTIGIESLILGGALLIGGYSLWNIGEHPEWAEFDEARRMVADTCIVTGLLVGGWLLAVALKGRYARAFGDVVGMSITLGFCSGWGIAFLLMASETQDAGLRMKLMIVGAALFALMAGCAILTLMQRMHRQTEQKLLRIEYHLAELLERSAAKA